MIIDVSGLSLVEQLNHEIAYASVSCTNLIVQKYINM